MARRGQAIIGLRGDGIREQMAVTTAMNLTKRERRELAELEHMLAAEDPDLVARFDLPTPSPRTGHRVLRWLRWPHAR